MAQKINEQISVGDLKICALNENPTIDDTGLVDLEKGSLAIFDGILYQKKTDKGVAIQIWQELGSAAGSFWGKNGDALIPTDKLGSNNNVDLNIIRNAITAILIEETQISFSKALNLSGNQLSNVPDSSVPTDGVNRGEVDSLIATAIGAIDFSPYLLKAGDTMTGELIMGGNTISGLAVPTLDDQVATKGYVDGIAGIDPTDFVLKTGDTMTGVLNMGGNLISNASDPLVDSDVATKGYVDGIAGIDPTDFVQKSGDIMNGSLNFQNSFPIIGLPNPNNPNDAVNKQYADALTDDFVPLTGASMNGSLNFQNSFPIIGLPNPNNPNDAVNKQYADALTDDFVPLAGAAMLGSLDFQNSFPIVGLPAPNNPNDAVNKQYADALTDDFVPLAGATMGGSLNFQNSFPIIGLPNPNNPNDAVNKQYADALTDDFVPLTGATMGGSLDFQNSFPIVGLPAPSNPNDAVNKQYADSLTDDFLPLTGGIMSGPVSFQNSFSITDLPAPSNDGDASNKKYVDDAIAGVGGGGSGDINDGGNATGATIVIGTNDDNDLVLERFNKEYLSLTKFLGVFDIVKTSRPLIVESGVSDGRNILIGGDISNPFNVQGGVEFIIGGIGLNHYDAFSIRGFELENESWLGLVDTGMFIDAGLVKATDGGNYVAPDLYVRGGYSAPDSTSGNVKSGNLHLATNDAFSSTGANVSSGDIFISTGVASGIAPTGQVYLTASAFNVDVGTVITLDAGDYINVASGIRYLGVQKIEFNASQLISVQEFSVNGNAIVDLGGVISNIASPSGSGNQVVDVRQFSMVGIEITGLLNLDFDNADDGATTTLVVLNQSGSDQTLNLSNGLNPVFWPNGTPLTNITNGTVSVFSIIFIGGVMLVTGVQELS